MSAEFASAKDFQDYIQNKAATDEGFRARLLSEPRAVIEEELDLSIPDDFHLHVHEDTATTAHLVIPPSAAIAEEDLQAVAGGGNMDWCSPV